MAEKKRLFLLDAYALIFRGYYALIKNPRINSKGMDTSAILGFTNSLLDVINREKPDYLAVAFDKGGSKIRNDIFPEYKSNRLETPEAIKIAVPYIHRLLRAMDIPIVEKEGFEADDLIGTLSKQAEKEGFKVFMVTPDKDFAQLVSENIFMYRPARMGNGIEIWGIPEVQKRFEIERPEQVIDYLGMMGDAVDNIPGLPGVGDKTAKKFLKIYGSMENLLANTHELKGKMKEKIEANKDLGLLSKELATILLDCPVEFNADNFELNHPNFDEVFALFKELEFRRTAENFAKIFRNLRPEPELKPEQTAITNENGQMGLFENSSSENHSKKTLEGIVYQYINSGLAQKLLLNQLISQKKVSVYFEISGERFFNASLLGIAFSYEKSTGYYIPVNSENTEQTLKTFRLFFEDEKIEKVGQNLKLYKKLLAQFKINLNGLLFDVPLAHYLLQPDMRHDLNVLTETYLSKSIQPLSSLIGKKGKNQLKFEAIELKKQTDYACEKADYCLQLEEIFNLKLEENNLIHLFKDIEIPLLAILAKMEVEGITLNANYLANLSEKITAEISDLETAIYNEANTQFNLASPKQLGDVLFEQLKLVEKPKKTKTGQFATGEEILSKLANEHPIVQNILNWRGLVKLKNTYIDALPNEINPKTNRIHTTYSQAVAATGRLSSNNPNLQNIPIRTQQGKQVRKAFVAKDENHLLLAADYSQIELRIIAALSQDESMIQAFKRGEDIHKATAAKVFNVPLESVTREQRSDAKAVNFGIIYGQGAFTLAQQLNKTRTEAKALIDNYYNTFPSLKTYIENQVKWAQKHGYVETILKRRRYLKNINSQNAIVRKADERNAVNAPIQGSAADIIKLAMIQIDKLLNERQFKAKMLLQIHDELVFEIPKNEIESFKPLLKETMENAYKLTVPLIVDIGEGTNWLEAH
ncbi:MAG: DNA polymerase I [Lutibacter sp.]